LGEQLNVHPEALRNWVRQAEADAGQRHGRPTSDMLAENRRLAAENAELRRVNEVLRARERVFRQRDRPDPEVVRASSTLMTSRPVSSCGSWASPSPPTTTGELAA
jgi:transposase-like protein